MAYPVFVPGSERGRHRRPPRRMVVLVATAGLLGALSVSAAAAFTGETRAPQPAGCPTLRVMAAPEVAPAVETVASSLPRSRCNRVVVSAADPASTAAELERGTARIDVWVPDSSMWAAKVKSPTSIASSPVVLAVPRALAREAGPAATYDQLAAVSLPLTLQAGDPETSALTQAALVDLSTSLSSTSAQRGQLSALLRSLESDAGGRDRTVRVSTEQAVRAANAATGKEVSRAVQPAAGGRSMDYPYVVLATDGRVKSMAQTLLDALTSSGGRAELERLGFRTADTTARTLTAKDSRAALQTLAVVSRPTRTLALVDVSGSMASQIPGASGATRMDLARAALREGIRQLPGATVAGLWRFSANLTPSTDYEQVTPLTPLTQQSRRRLGAVLGSLDVDPDGGTGLYSSTLAAVRHVRAGYDAARVNSVIVLSDGKDEDATAHAISLTTLLKALRTENDPERPVRVITIAYGPDSDTAALRTISEVTGGTSTPSRTRATCRRSSARPSVPGCPPASRAAATASALRFRRSEAVFRSG